MHLDEGQLQRLVDDDLEPLERQAIAAHLADCGPCRALAADAGEAATAIRHRLATLGSPVPQVAWKTIAAAAPPRSPVRWAAIIALSIGAAGAAVAIPGTPLHDWVVSLLVAPTTAEGTLPESVPVPEPESSGLAVAPGLAFVVALELGGDASVRLELTDAVELQVRASGALPSYTSERNRLVVRSDGATVLTISVPRSAPRVEVRLNGMRVFLKSGGAVEATGPGDAAGGWSLTLPLP